MSDETPHPPSGSELPVSDSPVTQAPEPQVLPSEPAAVPAPAKTMARSWRRVFMVIGPLVVSTWICCGAIGFRSCASMAPGSANQTEARAVAQRYLHAVATHDWVRAYQLMDPQVRSSRSFESMRDLLVSHPELFEFDRESFDGHNYFSNMSGGDRLRLTGRLTGRSTARRTFVLDLQQQPDESWLVRTFHVNIDLASVPATTPTPETPTP